MLHYLDFFVCEFQYDKLVTISLKNHTSTRCVAISGRMMNLDAMFRGKS